MCVCLSEESGGRVGGGRVRSKVRGVKKNLVGLSGRQPVFSQDLA